MSFSVLGVGLYLCVIYHMNAVVREEVEYCHYSCVNVLFIIPRAEELKHTARN